MTREDKAAVEAAFTACRRGGVAPGDIVQVVLELAHAADPVPCAEPRGLAVTVVDEVSGEVEQKVIGPDGDFVCVTGPNFHIDGYQRWSKSGTSQLTIKRRPPESGEDR